MVRLIFLMALIAFSTVGFPASEIPFKLEKGFVLISGKAKKDHPIQAVVFTGSTFSFFNNDLLKRLKLDLRSTSDTLAGVPKEDALVFAEIPDLTFAEQRPVNVKMRQRSFDVMEKTLGHKVDMILGADYLNGRIVKFDFKKRVLRFLDNPPFDYMSERSVDPNLDIRVAMRMDEHLRTIFGEAVSLPVAEDVLLNGNRIRALFDTGSIFPVSIGPFASRKLSLGPVPERETVSRTQLRSISLNGYEMADVPALINRNWEDTETRYAAIIGVGVLQNFTVTFDWKHKWIALER